MWHSLCRLVKIEKTLEFGLKFSSKFRYHKIKVREFNKMKLRKFLLWAGFAQSKLSNHDAMTMNFGANDYLVLLKVIR